MIAISYRREDSTPVAGRLHDRLQADFGKGNVFMDFDSIPYGVDFREQIKQTLERARVVIAVIGPSWFGDRTKGTRRIDDPADFVRLEIATALQRGIPVIPVLIDDTPMPQVENLPADLQGLAFRNALVLDTGVDFHHHADRLIAGIREFVKNQPAAGSVQRGKAKEGQIKSVERMGEITPKNERGLLTDSEESKKLTYLGGTVLVVILIAFAGWYFVTRSGHPKNPPAISLAIATPVPVLTETPAPTATATTTPVSSAAVAPVTVPMPTPVVPPPIPADNTISDDDVKAFIAAHYQATERKDLDYLLSQYDEIVDYNADGRRDRAFIRNGYVNYFNRWPIASFSLGEIRVVRSRAQNTVTAYFEIRYFVRDLASNRSRQGRADETWTISKLFGALKIVSEKETVHGESPGRYPGRRR
jgi:TIR domain